MSDSGMVAAHLVITSPAAAGGDMREVIARELMEQRVFGKPLSKLLTSADRDEGIPRADDNQRRATDGVKPWSPKAQGTLRQALDTVLYRVETMDERTNAHATE